VRSIFAAIFVLLALLQPPDRTLVDPMDAITFRAPEEKARVSIVPGIDGSALRFDFNENCQGVFAVRSASAAPAWDQAEGISFWVKGDGSRHLGGLEMIWNGDYATRFACAFPIDGTDWTKVTVPWRDLIPELSKTDRTIDPVAGLAPSKLGPIQFGKWWYWRDYAAHGYAIDDIRLERSIPRPGSDYRPTGDPLAHVRAKLAAGKPFAVVTMGDSLTDTAHWTNREHNWPALFKEAARKATGSEVGIVNPAMGGTELRHNVILLPRWTRADPRPDLVTIWFGFNDYASGMRGAGFRAALEDAIDRVRRATGGEADVIVLTTCPSGDKAEALGEMAEACRAAAKARNAGLCDIYAAFQAAPDRKALFASDGVHLSLAGQELAARSVLNTVKRAPSR